MTTRADIMTVKQLATLSGVSGRTLRFYDEIGLLKPTTFGQNGYRYYDHAAALRLQQILFYRELGLSLDDIKAVLDQPDFDPLTALRAHKQALHQQSARLHGLIETIDNTIAHLEGQTPMPTEELFTHWSEEKQPDYETEIEMKYGETELAVSRQRWGSYSVADKARIKAEGVQIYRDMAAAIPHGPHSAPAQAIVARWHQHMRYFYEPTPAIMHGLAEMYVSDYRFAETLAQHHPDLPDFFRQAIHCYVDHLT